MMFRRLPLAAVILVLGSCAIPAPEAPPAPRPVATVSQSPLPAPVPASADWRDWPVTPGNWSYAAQSGGTVARYGTSGAAPIFSMTCDLAARQVRLATGIGSDLTVRTSTTARSIPAGAAIAAGDPLLDAISFSRGRFVVQQAGTPPLVLPTWTEIDRVTQDCRG